jgi:hypothetical protein
MNEFVDIFVNNSVAVAVVIYFLWKDATLTRENSKILGEVKTLLNLLVKSKEEEK